MSAARVPLYYRLLTAASGSWGTLAVIEAAAGLNPMSTPRRRTLLTLAVVFGHLEAHMNGARVEYRLTRAGEAYLEEAFMAYGSVNRFEMDDD